MRTLVVAAFVLAACSNDRGIMIAVDSMEPAVTKIRLFVGLGDPSTPTDLTIAGPHQLSNAIYFTRDPHDAADVVDLASGPRVAKFLYATSDDLPIVIAVGYDATDQPVAAGMAMNLAAPTTNNQVNEFVITLDAAAETSVFGTNGEVHLGLWSNVKNAGLDPYSAQCAGIQLGHDTPPYFVVSADDQDCDGYENGSADECTPNIYNGSTVADPTKPSCLIDAVDPALNAAHCYVGAQACKDGMGVDTASACAKTHVCLPATVCGECTGGEFECAANLDKYGHSPADGTYYRCPLSAHGGQLCATVLRLPRPPTGGYGCSDVQIGNDGFGSKLFSGAMEIDVLTGKDTSSSSCDATLKVVAGGATGGATEFSAIANYALVNNGAVAIPIELDIVDSVMDCTAMTTPCALINDEAAVSPDQPQCAAGWSPPLPATNITAGANGGSTITIDGKTMYYVGAAGTLIEVTRADSTQSWNGSTAIAISGVANIRSPKLSTDNTRMLFVATDAVAGTTALYEIATANLASAIPTKFIDPVPGRVIDSATYTPETNVLIISATAGVTPVQHLYKVKLTAATLGDASNSTELGLSAGPSGTTYERAPMLSANGLHLFYSSNRDGMGIYVSSRATLSDDFVRSVFVTELTGVSDASGYPFVTAENTEIYYNGVVNPGTVGLLRATRSTLP